MKKAIIAFAILVVSLVVSKFNNLNLQFYDGHTSAIEKDRNHDHHHESQALPPIPLREQSYESELSVGVQVDRSSDFPKTEIGRNVERHLRVIHMTGPEIERDYQSSLRKLKETPKETLFVLDEMYHKLPNSMDFLRFATVHTMGMMDVPETVGRLTAIAKTPYPQSIPKGTHHLTSTEKAKEVYIRVAATEGLARQYFLGQPGAEESLKDLFTHSSTGVKRVAVNAWLRKSSSKAEWKRKISKLKRILPLDQHYLIGQKPSNRADVPEPPELREVANSVDPSGLPWDVKIKTK